MRGRRTGPPVARRRGRTVAGLVAVALGVGVPSAPAVAGPSTASYVPHVSWTTCPTDPTDRCGTLVVPLDETGPHRGWVPLAVIEHPVAHSRGVLVFNPGGPGESGVEIFPLLRSLVPAAVRDDLTLVSFDERGTGASDLLDCGPDPAAAASALAGTAAATRTFAGLARSCRASDPRLFPTVTTTTSARDLDRLRQALGVRRIDYYGLSYGTVLGSVYRQLFPGHVRSVVLDGAVDADLSLATDAAWEAPSIGAALRHDLSACAATGACALGPHPLAAFLELRARLARSSLPAPGRGDALPVTLGDLDTATLLYVSVPGLTPGYPSAVAAALRGDGAPLRSVGLGLETDLDGRSLVGPLWTITCNDAVAHPGGRETAALARALSVRQPLGGAEAVANNLIGCPGWPTPSGAVAPLSRVRAPAPVVIGNTVDPNTPYASARALAAAVGGRLVTVGVVGHTWLLNAATDPCMQRVVGAYLVDGTLPARGTRCPG